MWKYLIILICLALFIGTFLINKRIKGPEYTKEEEEVCANCTNSLCKKSKKETKNCEELNHEQK